MPFSVTVSDAEEQMDGDPTLLATQNALLKASSVLDGVAASESDQLVLGCDTVIDYGGKVFGKPDGLDEARQMLKLWAGSVHTVVSGFAVLKRQAGSERSELLVNEFAKTEVNFASYDDEFVDWYLSCNEWQGRAGAYAIQERGSLLVSGISGDWWNVVGLPVAALMQAVPQIFQVDSLQR